MNAPTALQQAVRLSDQPELLTDLQWAPLPPGMGALIRIAIGETSASEDERRAAAGFLHAVCLHANADARRRLGLRAEDDLLTARTHHRLLIKWLHPDRNPDDQVLAERVNSAWTALKNPLTPAPMPSAEWPLAAGVPARSRFPVFLGVLLAGALVLLAVSLLPDAPVYVGGAESDAPPPEKASEDAAALAAAVAALPAPMPVAVTAPAEDRMAPPKTAPAPVLAPAPAARALQEKPEKPAPLRASVPVPAPAPGRSTPVTVAKSTEMPVAPAPKPVPAAVSADEAEVLLRQFQNHYGNGNLPGLMALFSAQAISLKGGREAIAADFGRVFQTTRQRQIAFNHARWQTVEDARRVRAGFQTELAYGGSATAQRRRGTIEMLVVRENGQARILELLVTE